MWAETRFQTKNYLLHAINFINWIIEQPLKIMVFHHSNTHLDMDYVKSLK